LRICEETARRFCEGRHLSAGLAVGDDLLQRGIAHPRLIERIREIERGAILSVITVASGTVLAIERSEIRNRIRTRNFDTRFGSVRQTRATGNGQQQETGF
jgi:hypothetical protein